MPDQRRFDLIEKVVADDRRRLDDFISTVMARLAKAGIPVVSSTSEVINPSAGQLVVSTADNMIHRYDGSTWIGSVALGGTTAATRHEAFYYQTVAQGIPNATDTRLAFNLPGDTSNDVTASGVNNTTFTLNRGGEWRISTSMRLVAATLGERHLFLNAGTTLAIGSRFGGATAGESTGVSLAVSADIRFAAGSVVEIGFYQVSGGTRNTDVAFGSSNFVSLTWMRP
ncbi:MAG: hypothetical protein M3460_04490 [Actinomycetota bacterium]|nr:hypothetical protein [Actinomycetota bacterium]